MNTAYIAKRIVISLAITLAMAQTGVALADGAPSVVTGSLLNNGGTTVTVYGTVNANNLPTQAWFEYGTNYSYLDLRTPSQSLSGIYANNTSATLTNLQPNTTYYFRATASNSASAVPTYGEIHNFTTSGYYSGTCTQVSVVTNAASANSGTSAVLSAIVNSYSGYYSGYSGTLYFQYGTDQSMSQVTPSQAVSIGYGQTNQTATVYNLLSNTTYYYRAVLSASQCGTLVYGQTITFSTNNNGCYYNGCYNYSTAPAVTTEAVTTLDANSATLSGSVNPNGSETSAWFEYGTSQSSLHVLPSRSMGSGSGIAPRTTLVLSLRSGTTYYYRLVAQNSYGTNYGSILSFTTLGIAPVIQPAHAPVVNPTSTSSTVPTTSNSPVIVATPDFSSGSVQAGDKVIYTLSLVNNGSAPANNVSVTLTLPDSLKYVESDPDVSSKNGSSYVFALGTINPADQKTVNVTLRASSDISEDATSQVNASIDYTDSANKRQVLSGSRSITLVAAEGSFFASVGGVFGRIGNIPGYIWFFIFLLAIILVITWIFFKKLRGTEPDHEDHL